MSALQNRAMLVNLSISAWTASKKDKNVSAAVKKQHGASEKTAGWFNKRLIDPVALEPISKIEGRTRDMHYKLTLPWGDNGDRILPAMAYMDYVDAMRAHRTEYENAVAEFVKSYPMLVQDARKMLGTMYEPGDYPDVTQIRSRFEIKTVFTPIPDAADFRVDVGDAAVDEIKQSITASVEERLAGATRECWNRLAEVVEKMATALEDPERVFRDTLVENIRTLVLLLPKLNVNGDDRLSMALTEVRTHLLIEPDALRKDKKLRAVTAAKAAEILEQRIKPFQGKADV